MNEVETAANILNSGGIIIFPTDTAFGIGCRIDYENAVKRLFNIRRRPEHQAVPVLFDSLDTINNYINEFPVDVKEALADKYWPGALTIILPAKIDKVPKLARGSGNTLGIRIPDNNIILSIINKTGVGILGPSANFHGKETPYNFEDLDPELVSLVDFVVKGECKLKQASTVIDVSVKPWQIIREGAVKLQL